MFNSKKAAGLLILIFLAVYIWLSFRSLTPPGVAPAATATTSFSAEKALVHVKAIAAKPHSSGTPAHDEVRSYIVNYCTQAGLETSVQEGTGIKLLQDRTLGGSARNVVARLKGTEPGKAVLVVAHYDSQPNTPGAADNGSAVAAMLETMSLLRKQSPLKNDVIFLFTDLEEVGQLGAERFVNDSNLLKEVGMVLNFDARGNSGVSFTFETSAGNGWMMKQFARAADKPVANSLAYEIYKMMPNFSDFTLFKRKGLSGLNSAFINGHSHYHSTTDTPENMDLRSLQHQGDLMLGMVRHFAGLDLTRTKSRDAIFFNPIGNWLLIYSMTWDLVLVALTLLLFAAFVVVGRRKGRINIRQMFAGAGLYLVSMVLVLALVWILQKSVLALYPHYSNFYGADFYNSGYYFITMAGLALLVFSLLFSRAAKVLSADSLFAGSLLFLVLLMAAIKLFVPTGAYILYIPLIPVLAVSLILYLTNTGCEEKPLKYALGQMLLLILPLGLWVPFVYMLFVVFSLSFPFVVAVFLCLFFPILIPVQKLVGPVNKNLLAALSLVLIVAGLGLAHFSSGYSKGQPLQTQLMYALDLDSQQALWVSGQPSRDEWTSKYITAKGKGRFDEFYPGAGFYVWKSKAEKAAVETGRVEVVSDSVAAGRRAVRLLVKPGSRTNSFDLTLPEGSVLTTLGGRHIDKPAASRRITFYAPPKEGVEVEFHTAASLPLAVTLIERAIGLPGELLKHNLPASMVPGPGYMSNTTQVKQTIRL
ncbi:MAG TPA: M28 family peptidase [Flavisolibacter sp.]|jgi:hypothetical protein